MARAGTPDQREKAMTKPITPVTKSTTTMTKPIMTKPAPSGRKPTRDEITLWSAVVHDVVPFHPDPTAVTAVTTARTTATSVDAVSMTATPPLPSAPLSPTLLPRPTQNIRLALPPLKPGGGSGIDRSTNERLRRGRMAIEARLDLHGLTQSAAHDAVDRFLYNSQRNGRRCVLVITGKGPVDQGGGILRSAVPRWLAEPGLRSLIVAIHHAQPRDGGDGALYLLLKRRRDVNGGAPSPDCQQGADY